MFFKDIWFQLLFKVKIEGKKQGFWLLCCFEYHHVLLYCNICKTEKEKHLSLFTNEIRPKCSQKMWFGNEHLINIPPGFEYIFSIGVQ